MIMVSPSLDDYGNVLPDNSHKSKHRIIVKRDSVNFSKVLTGIPVINNETKELVAFVELKWEKENHRRRYSTFIIYSSGF